MQQSHVLGASVLAGLLISTAAWADLTAEQVWQNWKDQTASYGQTVTTTGEARDGNALTVSGVSVTSDADGVKTEVRLDSIVLTEQGDGTVKVTMSEQIPISFVITAEGQAPQTVTGRLDQPGLTVLATDEGTATRYDFTAPTMTLTVDVPPGPDNPATTAVTAAVTAVAGTYRIASADLSQIDSSATADSARITVHAVDPTEGTGGTLDLTFNANALASTTKANVLPSEELEDMAAALAKGFAVDSTVTYGSSDFSMDFTRGPADNTQSSGSFGPGNVTIALDKDRLAYGGGVKEASLKVSGAQIPFPELTASFAESAFDLQMPVSQAETPQDFKLLTRLVDLKISDEIWSMFDPGAALPRDPATVVLDLSGTGRWLMDMFSPAAQEMDSVPGEINSLAVNDLQLRAVGAEVTGTGAFTFDNTDLTTFDGVPAPTGKLSLKIVGANGLLDRLSQSGLLPQDQVMGARMMMGLFARPGTEPDTLTSELEFKDKGFFANGQQLQ